MNNILKGWATAMLISCSIYAQAGPDDLKVFLLNSTPATVRIHNSLVTESSLFGDVSLTRLNLDTLELEREVVLSPSISAAGQAQEVAPGEVVVLEAKDRDGHVSVFMLTQPDQPSPLYLKYTVTREQGIYTPTLAGCVPAWLRPPTNPFAQTLQATAWMVNLVAGDNQAGE